MSDTLDHAREHYEKARQELAEREWTLINNLVVDAKRTMDSTSKSLKEAHGLVREMPQQSSLDYNGIRQDVLKGLEAMERDLKMLREKLGRIGVWEP